MNNKTSDIKLVYLYSTIKMMRGPINLKFFITLCSKVDPSKDMATDRKERQEEKDVMTSLWKKMYD